MAHALAELRYGIVAHQHEGGFKYGHNFAQTPFSVLNFKLLKNTRENEDLKQSKENSIRSVVVSPAFLTNAIIFAQNSIRKKENETTSLHYWTQLR